MRRSLQKHQLRLISEISVTPLLDLVLVLLLVFMIAAPLLREGGKLDLPSAASQSAVPEHISKLSVDADSTLTLDGTVLSFGDLPLALKKLADSSTDSGVLVQPHRDLKVQLLVDIMDALHRSGIRRTAVATQDP